MPLDGEEVTRTARMPLPVASPWPRFGAPHRIWFAEQAAAVEHRDEVTAVAAGVNQLDNDNRNGLELDAAPNLLLSAFPDPFGRVLFVSDDTARNVPPRPVVLVVAPSQ